MTDAPITPADIATFAAIAGTIFSLLHLGLRMLIEFLTAKFGNRMTVADQSAQCRFDHAEINALITRQNANIATMLQQNGEQIKALSEGNHAAELRHQIVLAKLQRIEDHIDRK
jgi:hypothetical protein